MQKLRIIGGSLALAALLAIAGALWAWSGNGRYQAVVNNSGLVLMTDTRTGEMYLGAPGGESTAQNMAKRWKWTLVTFP